MDLGSLLLLLALLLLAALFVARPLMQGGHEAEPDETFASGLLAERERILDALAELDADWELGKVPEEIYHPQRQQLVAQGAAVLKAFEASAPAIDRREWSDAKLEAMIATHKARRKAARK